MTVNHFGCRMVIKGGDFIKAATIRFSDKLHTELKLKTVKDGTTIQDYIVRLVKQDLDFNDKDDDLSDYQKK